MTDAAPGRGAIVPDERERELLHRVWRPRAGIIGWLGVVNHKQVGVRYTVTAFAFFLIGGLQALLLRIQLGTPESAFLHPEVYNQLFTMHGTTMLFLFAVPVTEAIAIYLAPLMIGTRDMPFPRLNAFGYWAYVAGGVLLYSSFVVGAVPEGGWFAYVPFTGPEFSPGLGMDFWLLGVTFIEVAGVIAAIELVALVLRCRAPGMALARIPLFVWASLTTAIMVLFAFPPLIAGSLMLELDRKVGTAFYDPAAGGDPVLWQHIFWWFGHPEVYIMLLPAIGILSMVIPTFARTRIVGYPFVAAAIVAIGIVSFGLWAHHMYAAGLPLSSLTFFAAGSLVIAIPSGVQVFSWIATMWVGTVRLAAPMLWSAGAIFTFVAGGITGVMVAIVPFDWQVHDTYFVVAHFHYVILGGVVFPLFAGLHYWVPKVTGRMPNDRAGRWGFWITFVGFHVTFFPQHIVGLIGMPRRVYTYPAGLEWEIHNLVSTAGAVISAVGFLVAVATIAHGARRGPLVGPNPWEAGTLEWATTSPPSQYNFGSALFVGSTDPLWDPRPVEQPEPDHEEWARAFARVDPDNPRREIILTSVLDGEPEQIVTLPTHSLWPLLSTLATTLFLIGVLVDSVFVGIVGAFAIVVCVIGWGWSREDELPADEVDRIREVASR